MMDGIAALGILAKERGDAVVVTHMSTGHDWSKVSTRGELDLNLSGAMGKASSFGLGMALARPDVKVWVFDGDGSLLMNLGSLVTVGAMAPRNMVHFVYENDAYDTTGGQPTPGAGRMDFAAIARGAGYARAFSFESLEDLQNRVKEVLAGDGPTLVVLKVPSGGRRPPAGLPRAAESFAHIRELLAQRVAR
ncbi:MAG: thiamine pyrophosphate-binding protein [Chloroflexi bacterium]|nr:thiamine pyrophosphate-binding protein [Chloroflexota bacterium]